MFKVAVIGGGIAGSGVAIYLQNLGIDVTLFEKKDSIVNGPPMCHLHAGGNLYPEISDEQCLQLLEESIELLRFYPEAIDFRPTIVAVQKDVDVSLDKIFNRLEKLKDKYAQLIKEDKNNKVLGKIEEYYKIYTKNDILKLKKREYKKPETLDDWMIPFAKNVNLDNIKWPVILVQEYGLNVFRIAASATLLLDKNLLLNSEVLKIEKTDKFIITYKYNNEIKTEKFDYLINAAGFETGKFDDMIGEKRERFTEFKAAYVVKWRDDIIWPEVVFLGERGTPKGMGQFTPYAGGYFQLHAMTKDITLFEDGLVKTIDSSYPKLAQHFINKIENGWEVEFDRSNKAIKHLQKFIPSFKAKAGYKPLYGAQQIPGDDADLRAAEVSFSDDYARCEIVKASSIFAMARDIVKKLNIETKNIKTKKLTSKQIDELACKIAKSRGYPQEMGKVINPFKG